MQRVIAALLVFVPYFAMAGPDAGMKVGDRVRSATLSTFWPGIEDAWGEWATVVDVVEGAPLSASVRYAILVPFDENPVEYALVKLEADVVSPIRSTVESTIDDCWVDLEYVWLDVMDSIEWNGTCGQSASSTAKVIGVLTALVMYQEPRTLILSKLEIDKTRPWVSEEDRASLRRFELEPRIERHELMAQDECLLIFRSWEWVAGQVHEWRVKLPGIGGMRWVTRLSLMQEAGHWDAWVDGGERRRKRQEAMKNKDGE